MPIPTEIRKFIDSNWGKSLIIKGSPGSGKTTLALEIMEYGLSNNGAIYISTRQGDQSLYNQFPWLRTEEYKNAIIDSSYEFLQSISNIKTEDLTEVSKDSQKITSSRKFLENIRDGTEPTLSLDNINKLNIQSPEFLRFIYLLKSRYKAGMVVLIDSIQGIIQRWRISEIDFIEALIKDLAESSRLNLILVSESSESSSEPIEYLVDAVVRLEKKIVNQRILRQMIIEKLRFIESKNKVYFYTLTNGRFEFFDPNLFYQTGKLRAMKEGTGIRFGMPEMDRIFNNDVKWFSMTLNVKNLPSRYTLDLFSAAIAAYLEKKMGAILVLEPGSDVDLTYDSISKYVDNKEILSNLRIGDFTTEVAIKKYILPLGFENPDTRNRELMKNIVSLMDETDGIFLLYRLSGLERIVGSLKNLENINPILSAARPKKDKLVLVIDTLGPENSMFEIGNYNFKILQEGYISLIYSDSPFTPYYSFQANNAGNLYLQIIE